jgi:HD-GYP domain-containing protein (c-di-GMP phosphodiesterase class II)
MSDVDSSNSKPSQSIQKINYPTLIQEAWSEDGELIVKDFWVESEEDLHRLEKLGASYYRPSEKSPPKEAGKELKTDESKANDFKMNTPVNQVSKLLKTQIEKNEYRYEQVVQKMQNIFEDALEGNKEFDELRASIEGDVEYFIGEARESPASLSALNQLQSYDDETYQHSLNVCIFSILYAEYRNFSRSEIKDLAYGAIFHDLGKTAISHEIIHKPDKLNEDEWTAVRNHPFEGKNILEDIDADALYQRIALEHHERPDGTGYPNGRRKVHPFSRIVCVCDVFEALTATRVYKKSIDPTKAFLILHQEFGEFPETRKIVSGLIYCLGIYPTGSLVQLSNGEIAIVKKVHADDLKKPTVIVVTDQSKRPLTTPVTLNMQRLSQKKGAHGVIYDDKISIQRVLPLSNYPNFKERIAHLIEKAESVPI